MYSAMFSDEEALRIAAQIERKGERFYRVAQKLSDSQEMTNLLELLRRQEEAHAARFESMLDELLAKKGDFEDETFSEESAAFLSALASEVVFPGGVMASMMNRKIDTIPGSAALRHLHREGFHPLLYGAGAKHQGAGEYTRFSADHPGGKAPPV